LVSRRLSGVGKTASRCVVAWLAAFGFPAAGLCLLEVAAGFFFAVVEVDVELDVCAHTAGISTSQIPTAALKFILIY
jgi:hypothetical protein